MNEIEEYQNKINNELYVHKEDGTEYLIGCVHRDIYLTLGKEFRGINAHEAQIYDKFRKENVICTSESECGICRDTIKRELSDLLGDNDV